MSSSIRTRLFIAGIGIISIPLVACAVDPEIDEPVEESNAALINNGGGTGAGLTGKECRDCGCELVLIDKGSCNYYTCVCPLGAPSDCATSKAVAASMQISDETPPPKPPKTWHLGVVGGTKAVFSKQ